MLHNTNEVFGHGRYSGTQQIKPNTLTDSVNMHRIWLIIINAYFSWYWGLFAWQNMIHGSVMLCPYMAHIIYISTQPERTEISNKNLRWDSPTTNHQLMGIRQQWLADSVTIKISRFIFHVPLFALSVPFMCSYGFEFWNIKQN